MVKTILLCATLILITNNLFANETEIRPFGALNWEDGFVQVILKLNQMKDLSYIDMEMGKLKVSMKGITDEHEIINKLHSSIASFLKDILNDTNKEERKQFFELFMIYFVDKDGVIKGCWAPENIEAPIKVIAEPIIIKGVPFKIVITFEQTPGLDVLYPNNIYKAKVGPQNSPGAYILAMKEVWLRTESNLLESKITDIMKIIGRKYKQFGYRCFSEDTVIECQASDGDHNSFEISGYSNSYLNITYKPTGFIRKIENAYKKHLQEIEKDQLKGGVDQSNGL